MTILEKFISDSPLGGPDNKLDPDEFAEYIRFGYCPSMFYDIQDPTGCDHCDEDRCERCWDREFREE